MTCPGGTLRTDLLACAPFVACLAVLVLNDSLLKPEWHNAITGKLSDFSGIAVFCLFWIAFLPAYARSVLIATATGFAWWKSPLSQPLIELWNARIPLQLARTVDYSDLLALLELPAIAAYVRRGPVQPASPYLKTPLAACALAAMMGTSKMPDTPGSIALQNVRDERVSRYGWSDTQIGKEDMRRLVALLRTLPENSAHQPSTVYRSEHRGDTVINVTHELPEYGISVWYYPNPGRTGEIVVDPRHIPCDRALAQGATASDPLIHVKIDFRALPAEPWVTRVALELCDLQHKRTYDEALRYFFDTVLPTVEAALIPH